MLKDNGKTRVNSAKKPVRNLWHVRRIKADPRRIKFTAVFGAIEPGCEVPITAPDLRSRISTKPVFQPRKFRRSERIPASIITSARNRTTLFANKCERCKKMRASPASRKHAAVSGFIASAPRANVLRTVISNCQPARVKRPTSVVIMLATTANEEKENVIRENLGNKLLRCIT